MKKTLLPVLIILSIIGQLNLGFSESENLKEKITLTEVRNAARLNVSNREEYEKLVKVFNDFKKEHKEITGEKYFIYDENGNEITKYRNGIFIYDYEQSLDNYKDTLKNLKLNNEIKSIIKFGEILHKENEIEQLEFQINIAEKENIIDQKKLELGMIYKHELTNSKSRLEDLKLKHEVLEKQLENLYIDLNRILGWENREDYALDSESILKLFRNDDFEIYVPEDAIDLAIKEYAKIEDIKEELEVENRELKNMNQVGTAFSDKELLYNIRKMELENELNNLENNLESLYRNILIQIAEVDNTKSTLVYDQYLLGIDSKKYELGLISNLEYRKKHTEKLEKESQYIIDVVNMYISILEYNRNFNKLPEL